MNRPLSGIWKELALPADERAGIRRLRLDPECFRIYAGWTIPIQQPALVLEVSSASLPGDLQFPQSVGFMVSTAPLTHGRNGEVRITIEAQDDRFTDIFPVFIQDVYDHITAAHDEQELVRRTVSRLCHWQIFLKRHRQSRLSENEQTGLWGELWFLRFRLLGLLGPDLAINSWQGPEGRNQDFEFTGTAVEVKTTTANPHERLCISNVRQLEPAGLERLYLCHLAVAIHRESGMSLPVLVSEIREMLQGCLAALESFNQKLFHLGYLDSEASWYGEKGYHVLSHRTYHVREGFPRISLESLPDGVGDVKFSLVLCACRNFQVSYDPFGKAEEVDE